MAKLNYKAGPGRRSKGARKAFMTRLPLGIADSVEAEATAREVSLSEYLALLAQIAHVDGELRPEFENLMPPRVQPTTTQSTIEEIDELSRSA